MDSAATPPAKRAAPRVVAKAKRLILPPESDDDELEASTIDPGVRAKRAARQPRSRKAPPPIAETVVQPDLDSSAAVVPPDLDPSAAVEQPAAEVHPPVIATARVAPPPTVPPVELPPADLPPPPLPAGDAEADQPQLFDDEPFAAERPMRSLRQPITLTRRRRPRVRRVTRVVRHVDTWSVFKIALLFNLFFYLVCLTASVLLWQVAQSSGTVDNIERFFEGFGWQTFQLKGGELYHNLWIIGLFLVVGGTGLAVLLATMFNLVTDLVGGVRVTVLEEEVVSRVKLTTLTAQHEPAADTEVAEPTVAR